MVCDYEAAWHELAELVASKSQHGREPTLIAMAEIAGRNRVPSGELSRLLRLYGVEVERARAISTNTDPDEGEVFGSGDGSLSDHALLGHHHPIGGHDGGSNGNGRPTD